VPALHYDPTRLAPLRTSAGRALRHLLGTGSSDPAAASAVRVAALVRSHLEHHLLPAVDRLVASDAMLGWRATGPSWIGRLAGDALGTALAARAAELASSGTPADVAALVAALRHAAGDEEAEATFVTTLGAEGLLHLVVVQATVDTDSIALPLVLRDCLVRTARADGLPDGFGRQLVQAAVVLHERSGGTGDVGLALSFLFHGGDLPGDVVVDAIDEAIVQELARAAQMGYFPDAGAVRWASHDANGARGLWLDFDEPARGEDLDATVAQDPMYALLAQLARPGNGAAGRATFTDVDRARYLFTERDVLGDGGRAITAAAANAAAGPDIVRSAPAATLTDASVVASVFVNRFGRDHADDIGRDDRASSAVASIVSSHMYAVQHATGSDRGIDDADRARTVPADRRRPDLDGDADVVGAVADLANGVFADPREAAVFDPAALDAVLDLAARTDASVEVLRDGLGGYQRGSAAAVAARLTAGGVAPSDVPEYLAEVMADSGRLEGRLAEHVGREARRRGRDADQLWTFWIGAIGEGLERGAGVFSPTGSAVVHVVRDVVRGELADAGALTRTDARTLSELAAERLVYMWVRELHAAGLLTADLPAGILVDGELPPYDDLVVALATGGPPAWEISTVIQQFDESRAGLVDIDGPAMLDAMGAAQQRHVEASD
jgi:hypothetical protein